MTRPTSGGYSLPQIGLHWLIAVLVLFQLIFGESMTEFVDARAAGAAAAEGGQASLHYYIGIAILVLAALRLALRLLQGAPPVPRTTPALELAGKATHWLFYLMLLSVPVAGLLAYYVGGIFGDLHSLAKPAFIIVIALHIAAALYHQYWRRDGLLVRMLRPVRK